MAAFTYFLPFIFHWELMGDEIGTPTKVWYAINILGGMVVMIGGLYSATDDLLSASSGAECHLDYAYAPLDPDDPCFNTTLPTGI